MTRSDFRVDLDDLDPQLARTVAEAEIRRLEAEQAEAEQRIRQMDDDATRERYERADREQREAAARTADLASNRISGAMSKVHRHLDRAADPSLSGEQRRAEETLARDAFRRVGEWRELSAELRRSAQVIEPDIYRRGGENSYFSDVAAAHDVGHRDHRAALTRLEAYGNDLNRDMGKAGLRARQVWREASRKAADLRDASDRERRAMSTNAASGGSLVPPLYIVDDFATYRAAPATFWEQVTTARPLPDYGMTVDVPKITGPASVANTPTENSTLTEVDPTAAYVQQPVLPFVGIVTASQQLHDRQGPGSDFDAALYAQIRESLDAQVDLAVINAAIAGAGTVTRTSASLTLPQLLSDVGQAASKLQTTAGTMLPPSALVAHPGIGEWLLAQVNATNGEAWFKPSLGGQRSGDGITGQSAAGVPIMLDANIPASGSNAQLLVANKSAIFVYSGAPVVECLQVSGVAGLLSVQYRLRQYVAIVPRYAAGVCVISGTGYPAAPTFA